MKITVFGSGYVGLVTGACFAELGCDVTCLDKNIERIDNLNQGIIPIYEPGLETMILQNRERGRLEFTTNFYQGVQKANLIFIAVGTPSCPETGRADLTAVYKVAEEIAQSLNEYKVIVTKSTVPVGTGRRIEKIIRKHSPDALFDIVSNPEFLREGSAIDDFMKPDRVVVGAETDQARSIMKKLYHSLCSREGSLLFTDLQTAELIKYASNAFLSTKVAFINEIANLCEKCGADVQKVSQGMGLDQRIGDRFLNAGPGYGGSCFPKDTLALIHTAQDQGVNMSIIKTVIESNIQRKQEMSEWIIKACGGSINNKKLCILGVTFKPNTDDMRDAPSLDIIPALHKAGAILQVFDPQGQKEGKILLPQVKWFNDAYQAMQDAEAIIILTEWNDFKILDFAQIKALLKKPFIIDLRNIYEIEQMKEEGFEYISIGRQALTKSLPEFTYKEKIA